MDTGKGSSCKASRDCRAAYPDSIVMNAGETLQVGESDPEYEGWVWCTGQMGKSGFPKPPPSFRCGPGKN